MNKYLAILFALGLFSCNENTTDHVVKPADEPNTTTKAAPAAISAAVLSEYPHDTAAFTEGLFVYKGKMYEGTGLEGKSYIQVSDIKTGKIEQKHKVKDNSIFGEGINIINDKLYQLTYQNHIVYVYNLNDLSNPIKKFQWESEGWGMTNNGMELIISDGGKEGNLYFVNPEDFTINRRIQVTVNNAPVENVNELEYIDGFIYANEWGTTHLLKINPATGNVVGILETADILKSFYANYRIVPMDNVLNGIAYDSDSKKIYITGKKWPKIFEVRLN